MLASQRMMLRQEPHIMETDHRSKLGKLQVAHRHTKTLPEHHPVFTFLYGLYSCRWAHHKRRKTEPGKCCCKKTELAFFPFLVLTFFTVLAFLYLMGETKNDYNSFDIYNFQILGYWFLWSIATLAVAAVLFSYIFLLLMLAFCMVIRSEELYLHWIHKVGTLLSFVLAFSCIIVLVIEWPGSLVTISLSFQITAPFLHMVALIVMVILSWPTALHAIRLKKKVLRVMILAPYLACLIFLLFIPIGVYSPCIMESDELGPKPLLIANGGAPMLAPENTDMAFRKAIAYGAYGFDTIITFSYDGIPFLMHDRNLRRTTNIEDVAPLVKSRNPSLFPWEFLKLLNAGEWFVLDKPFFNMPPVSAMDEKWARNQTICKFSDYLKLADQANKSVYFETQPLPRDHPYVDTWLQQTLDVIVNETKIKPHLVQWQEDEYRHYVQAIAPGFKHISTEKISIEELRRKNIVQISMDYRKISLDEIRMYTEANVTINLWVINEPWLFSLAWCTGVHSVITNALQNLGEIHQPLFLMEPGEYHAMWILMNLVSVFIIAIIFGVIWWQERSSISYVDVASTRVKNEPHIRGRKQIDSMPMVD